MVASSSLKLFLEFTMPLASLVCLWFSVIFLYRGLRMLVRRICQWSQGLHASGVLCRQHDQGRCSYVPVFSYTCSQEQEVDILGSEEYESEAAALQARRGLVYESERPDAPMARNQFTYFTLPLFLLVQAVALSAVAYVLLIYSPS